MTLEVLVRNNVRQLEAKIADAEKTSVMMLVGGKPIAAKEKLIPHYRQLIEDQLMILRRG